MPHNIEPRADSSEPKGLLFDPADYGIGPAHYHSLHKLLKREGESVRNSAKHGGHRSREDFDRVFEILDLVAAVCETETHR